jgi:hypothetical protein
VQAHRSGCTSTLFPTQAGVSVPQSDHGMEPSRILVRPSHPTAAILSSMGSHGLDGVSRARLFQRQARCHNRAMGSALIVGWQAASATMYPLQHALERLQQGLAVFVLPLIRSDRL